MVEKATGQKKRIGRYIRELIALGALDDIVQDEHVAVVAALEDQDVLVLGLLMVQYLVDLEGHGLAGPHVRPLVEPSICGGETRIVSIIALCRDRLTMYGIN